MFKNLKSNRQFNFFVATGIAFHRVRLVSLHASTFSSGSFFFCFSVFVFWNALFYIFDNNNEKKNNPNDYYKWMIITIEKGSLTDVVVIMRYFRNVWRCSWIVDLSNVDTFNDFALFSVSWISFVLLKSLFQPIFNDAFQNDSNFLFHWIDQQFNWMHSTEACIIIHRTFFIRICSVLRAILLIQWYSTSAPIHFHIKPFDFDFSFHMTSTF